MVASLPPVGPPREAEMLIVNGIDGVTGGYLVPPIALSSFYERIRGDSVLGSGIRGRIRRLLAQFKEAHLGLPAGVDATDYRQAGWGVVYHNATTDAVKRAVQPLLEHRRRQVHNDELVRELVYREGESWAQWLARNGAGPGSVRPKKVPYYLLVVGPPDRIPFLFTSQLGMEYSIGRLHFERDADYDTYVRSLIDYETAASVPNDKSAVFFGTRHSEQDATQLSADHLVSPLADGKTEKAGGDAEPGVAAAAGYRSQSFTGQAATKDRLLQLLTPGQGACPPALLFTATHGMGWPKGDTQQRAAQGALLCQDWPGAGTIAPDHYVQATDVPDAASVHGLLAFHFACYSAGTPAEDRYNHAANQPPPVIADSAFIAALPQRLLSHGKGGALAIVGHVERAWGFSIVTPGGDPEILPFENALHYMLRGVPVGHAMRDFSQKYATVGNYLAGLLERAPYDKKVRPAELATAWVQRNDAEGYLILGDPAARLRVDLLHAA
jgi:hypothetical protein